MSFVKLVSAIGIVFISITISHSQILPTPSSLVVSAGFWLYQNTNRSLFQVDVEASASSFEEAKSEGFRLAVDQAVGSLILSATELNNGAITRQEIINYASGYVDRFEIQNRSQTPGLVTLKLRVWVSHSQISNRLLHNSAKSGEVEGPRASAQIGSLVRERQSGDNAINHILKDFPQRSFDIEIGKTTFNYENNRTAKLELLFKIKWNHDYLMALTETLENTSSGKADTSCRYSISPPINGVHCPYSSYIQIKTKIPNKFFFSKRNINYGFDDDEKLKLFVNHLIESRPAILLTVKNESGEVYSKDCYRWVTPQFESNAFIAEGLGGIFANPSSKIYLDGWVELNLQAPINFNQSLSVLNNLGKVDVDVVRSEKCPR